MNHNYDLGVAASILRTTTTESIIAEARELGIDLPSEVSRVEVIEALVSHLSGGKS